VRYVYLYDETGRLIEEQIFEPDGTVASGMESMIKDALRPKWP
jgi:hypothetical protein